MGGWQVAGGRPSWGAAGGRSKSSGPILQRREVLSGRASQWGSRGEVYRTERWGKSEGEDQRVP